MNDDRFSPNRAIIASLTGVLFTLAYSQAPLFTSNQNQYFLHGLAAAGYGNLAQDWLAGTLDPTPVFSWLVQATYAGVGDWFFYVEYGLLLAVTFWGLVSIAARVVPTGLSVPGRLILAAVLTALFSEALRVPLSHLPWTDGGYLFEGGLAGQRLLGPVFEPSAFGGLLVVSIALFLADRPYAAALLAAGAASLHPTYLLTAACLVIAYIGILALADHRQRSALACGALALAGVLPILLHTLSVFGLSTSQVSADAARVLVDFRIPHHAIPAEWLDPSVALKLVLIVGAMLAVRRSRLLLILLIPAVVGLALTGLQIATSSDRLALIFPWRVSALLVPLSTAILAGKGVALGLAWLERRSRRLPAWSSAAARIVLACLALAGTASFAIHIQRQADDPQQQLFAEVRHLAAPGQVYLIPPRQQDFRLATGQPVFVDFKAIPYAPAEVLTWYDRIQLAQFFYRDNPADVNCHLLDRAAAAGVTHVVLEPEQRDAHCEGLHKLWSDDAFEVDRLGP